VGGLKLTAIGIAAGTVLGLGATSFLSWIFFGLHPFDLRVFIGSAAMLTGVALVASWWPARNAMQVEPIGVLKH